MSRKTKSWIAIIISLLLAITLILVRLPTWAEWLWPHWILLVIAFWAIALPQSFSLGVAWLIGILLDVLYNAPIGENALALTLVVYFLLKFSARIYFADKMQQLVIIFAIVILYQLLPFMMHASFENCAAILQLLTRAAVSALIWPCIWILLSHCQRKFDLEKSY